MRGRHLLENTCLFREDESLETDMRDYEKAGMRESYKIV